MEVFFGKTRSPPRSTRKESSAASDVYKGQEQMLDLLVQRFSVSREIGEIKASDGINVGDPNREQEIIDRLAEKLEGKLERNDIAAIFGPIYHISKKLQKK